MNVRIPDDLTPDQLRREADQRELRGRRQRIMDRRAARNVVVDALLAIDSQAVRAAGASEVLKSAVVRLAQDDKSDDDKRPSNAEISAAGNNWWPAVRESVPEVQRHKVVERIIAGNYTGPTW